ncbi:hypothetical protein [Polyangium sp. 6x1]|uniref:hypothetical protein n=1 Tax=Polyangium sp. 6x1 TaxID=3042689 RepID=UPI0024830A7B|nr:hypothetical protein [Polyangium sp. 6x1]MDI1444183.1 hypothetical protein [Polyangium sp. 6x1]
MKAVQFLSVGASGLVLFAVSQALAADPTKDRDPGDQIFYPTPIAFEVGPAVQIGGPHPYPISVGGRVGMHGRIHRYFSLGGDVTFVQTVRKAEVFGAPVGGSHFRIGARVCTHAKMMFFCLAGAMAGMTVVSANNIASGGFPNDVHFLPMLGIGAELRLNDWFAIKPMMEGGPMIGVPVTMVDNQPERVYEPFPLFGTLSINFAITLPTMLKPGEKPQ